MGGQNFFFFKFLIDLNIEMIVRVFDSPLCFARVQMFFFLIVIFFYYYIIGYANEDDDDRWRRFYCIFSAAAP